MNKFWPVDSWGKQISELLKGGESRVLIVAPFIKKTAFENAVSDIKETCGVTVVTRWLVDDVVNGVSDLEILDLVDEKDNFDLRLLDNLHAKLYLADKNCLLGSANLTLKALGVSPSPNKEFLLSTNVEDHPEILEFVGEILRDARPATVSDAQHIRDCIKALPQDQRVLGLDIEWVPISVRPQDAYSIYLRLGDGSLINDKTHIRTVLDIARSRVPGSLDENAFHAFMAERLQKLIDNHKKDPYENLTIKTFETVFNETASLALVEGTLTNRVLYTALTNWISYFLGEGFVQPAGDLEIVV